MRFVVLLIFLFFTNYAWSFLGIDTLEGMKQYYVLLKQLKELKEQVVQYRQMLDQEKKLIEATEGHYSFGQLLDHDSDFKKRQWGQYHWYDALKNLSGGNSERYKELLNDYEKNHTIISDKQFSKGASQSLAHSYRQLVEENRVATASSDYEYEYINSHLDHIHQLTKKIESTSNIKSAMDLNSRLISELSYISVDTVRMQTLMNHQIAEKMSEDIAARTRESIFNKLPKEINMRCTIFIFFICFLLISCSKNSVKTPCPNFGAHCHKIPINKWNYNNASVF